MEVQKASENNPVRKTMKIKDVEIPYIVERRDVKNSRLEFNQGKLLIVLSKREPSELLLIHEKQNWILKNHLKIKSKLDEIRQWHGENEIMIFGEKFQIKTVNEKLPQIDIENKIIFENKNSKKFKQLLKNLLKLELEEEIKEIGEKLNQHPEMFRIKNQRTAWGSCSSKRNMNFNLRLVFLPKELIYFVVFHEMLHLRYMSHGKRFHAVMNLEFGTTKYFENELKKWWHYVHLTSILKLLNPT